MPVVREAVQADSFDVASVHVASWKAAYQGILPDEYLGALAVEDRLPWWERRLSSARKPTHHVFVVEDDEEQKVVGFAAGGPTDGTPSRTAEVWQLYLHPGAWGRGLGRELLDALVTQLRKDRYADAVLWVAPGNERARRLYDASGWIQDGTERTETIWGVEAISTRYHLRLGA